MNIPEDLKYTASHEWAKSCEGGIVEIGLSDYAQEELGDIVFINLPKPGDSVKKGTVFADVESVKAVSDIISPLDGIVKESNAELQNAPELINKSSYTAWLIRVEGAFPDGLLSAAEYKALLKQE